MRYCIQWSSRSLISIIEYLLRDHNIQEEAIFTHLRILRWHGCDIRGLVAFGNIKGGGPIRNPGCSVNGPVRDRLDTTYSFGSGIEDRVLALLRCCGWRESQIPHWRSRITHIGEVIILPRFLCKIN